MKLWRPSDLRAPWRIVEVGLSEPAAPLSLGDAHGAYLLARHRGRPAGRLLVGRSRHGAEVSAAEVARLADRAGGRLARAYAVHDALTAGRGPAPTPSLTIAVCTRNRAALLGRCLGALVALRDARASLGEPVDLLVVDNAPTDASTRETAARFEGVRYAVEPVPGLDFGRNRALGETARDWLGFVDDDAVPDPGWLDAVAEAARDAPGAGALTGPVLPLVLETEAQIRFEAAGGFGQGVAWELHRDACPEDPYHPANAGRFGTGANMVFRTETLRRLGGFDEALDTGPPLPGGGDIDMLYRVVRSGAPVLYGPAQAVRHEHRRDMAGLRRQYRSWGLSIGALTRKNAATDPETRAAHRRVLRWIVVQRLGRTVAGVPLRRSPLPVSHPLSELGGLIQGLAGEYGRSRARMAERRARHGAEAA